VKDIALIFDGRRINRLNIIMLGAMTAAVAANALLLGQFGPPLAAALAVTLAFGLAVLALPLAQPAKSLLIPLAPALAVSLLVAFDGGRSWYHLAMLGTVAMGTLYFRPRIVLAGGAVVNTALLVFWLAGVSVAGPAAGPADNLNHLLQLDLIAAIMYLATKWGSEHASRADGLARQATGADRELRELNATLESKVAERTRELAKMIEDLQAAQHQLIISEKQASLGALVAGVAHEVNTPLGVCITAITKMKGDQETFLAALADNTLTRGELARHANSGNENIDIISLNLIRAAEIIRSFKEIAVDQGSEVMVEFCLDDYIRTILTSYPGAFSHIITNFIMNTLMHAYDQRASMRIDFDARREADGTVVFDFTDHGKGIPPEILTRIFDPFFTTRRGTGGSGLGLNIVYNTVREKLRGSIVCTSVPGEFTTFTIRL
jgi:signal transduction histidine kinase